jgi:hypothetical protein
VERGDWNDPSKQKDSGQRAREGGMDQE